MRTNASTGATRKQKRSYTLSLESVAFLERLRKSRRERSSSRVLDELISDARLRARRSEVHQAMDTYYDSLSDDEVAEDAAWGRFALRQVSKAKDWA